MGNIKLSDLETSAVNRDMINEPIGIVSPKTWQGNIEDCIIELQKQVKELSEK